MQKIFHVGITVSNLDHAVEFYKDVLGLKLVTGPTGVFEGEDTKGIGLPGAALKLAIFEVGDGTLELQEYLNPKSSVDKAPPTCTLGVQHLAFQVEDAVKKMEELKAKGVEFKSELNIIDDGPLAGWKWVYFSDPDGTNLEIIEYNPPGK